MGHLDLNDGTPAAAHGGADASCGGNADGRGEASDQAAGGARGWAALQA